MYFPRFVRFCIFKSNTSNTTVTDFRCLARRRVGVSAQLSPTLLPTLLPPEIMAGAGNADVVVLVDEVDNYTWSNPNLNQLDDSVAVPFVRGAPRHRENQVVSAVYERPVQMATWMAGVQNGLEAFPSSRRDVLLLRVPCFLV
jgi:hypothetical protein